MMHGQKNIKICQD